MENLSTFDDLVEGIINERKPKKENSTNFQAFKATPQAAIKNCFTFTVKIGLRIPSKYRKTKKISAIQSLPEVCVVSLSREQLFKGKTKKDLLAFFKEERFGNPNGEILVETRELKHFFTNSRSFKASLPLHFFFHRLGNTQKKEVIDLFVRAFDSYSGNLNPGDKNFFKTIYDLFEFVVWYVIKEEPIHILTTQSTMHILPVSFRIPNSKFIRKMLWYSTNSQPITKRNAVVEKPNFSKNLNSNVDLHFVWDLNSRKFLESNGISRISIVGSILFVKQEIISVSKNGLNLVYFDVTPFENANTYYTEKRMIENLCSLIEVVEKLSLERREVINLLVKPKRETRGSHSRGYIEKLDSFERYGRIQILRPETNLYGLIANADVVIGIPFTSPVVVGREMGIRSAFMDVHDDEFLLPETHNEFPVLTNQNLVMEWLRDCLRS